MQIKVDDKYSKLPAINTPWGMYKFSQSAFGWKVAPAIFQQVMYTMLSGLDFAVTYLDDILLKNENPAEHKKNVFRTMDSSWKKKNVNLFMNKIEYLGQVIDKNGRRPDPACASAIEDIPAPENISSLQSFLGLTNYYKLFVLNMHCLQASLSKLLKKTLNGFGWQSARKCLKKIKGILASHLFLTHYDPKKEIIWRMKRGWEKNNRTPPERER